MATLPTIDQTIRAVLDAIGTYNVRPNEIVPLSGVQMKIFPRFTADDYRKALMAMEEKGWITGSSSSVHFTITEAGFEQI